MFSMQLPSYASATFCRRKLNVLVGPVISKYLRTQPVSTFVDAVIKMYLITREVPGQHLISFSNRSPIVFGYSGHPVKSGNLWGI